MTCYREFPWKEKDTFPSSHILCSTTLWLPWTQKFYIVTFHVYASKCISFKHQVLLISVFKCPLNHGLPVCMSRSVSLEMHSRGLSKVWLDEAPQALLWRSLAMGKKSEGKTGGSCLVKLLWSFNFKSDKLVRILHSIHKLHNFGLLEVYFN